MEEIWKDIDGYEGLYQVSTFGNVKSLNYCRRGYAKALTPKCNNCGRLWVELFDANGGKKQFLIHRLVGDAFIPNPNNYPQINHIDENPKNNHVENLEWCTGSYNVSTYIKNHPEKPRGRRSGVRYRRQHDKRIYQLSPDGTIQKEWIGSRDVEIETGWSAWSISECCRGNRHRAYGYIWRYASEYIDGREVI